MFEIKMVDASFELDNVSIQNGAVQSHVTSRPLVSLAHTLSPTHPPNPPTSSPPLPLPYVLPPAAASGLEHWRRAAAKEGQHYHWGERCRWR